MSLDQSKVLVGSPYEGVNATGAVYDAPTTASAPTDASTDLNPQGQTAVWRDSGYVSEDGIELTQEWSTNDVKEWGGNIVRKVLEEFKGQVKYTEIQALDEVTLKRAYGDGNVVVTPATAQHGKQVKVSIGAELPPIRSFVFNMKDGDNRIRIYIPRGQVSAIDTVNFKNTEVIGLPLTVDALVDSNNKCIYIFSDDGQTTNITSADDKGNVSHKTVKKANK